VSVATSPVAAVSSVRAPPTPRVEDVSTAPVAHTIPVKPIFVAVALNAVNELKHRV